jgi:predicted nucleic acid-binding protein
MRKTWSVILHLSKVDKVVSNASPLIYLSIVGNLHLLKDLFGSIIIPTEVFREVCGVHDTPDSLVIAAAVDNGWIHTENAAGGDAGLLAKSSGIDIGEAAAILLAKEERALLLIDDKMGRSTAEILGVKCFGTVGVLLQALSDSILSVDEFVMTLDRMIDSGFRLDSKVYRLAMRVAKDIDKK